MVVQAATYPAHFQTPPPPRSHAPCSHSVGTRPSNAIARCPLPPQVIWPIASVYSNHNGLVISPHSIRHLIHSSKTKRRTRPDPIVATCETTRRVLPLIDLMRQRRPALQRAAARLYGYGRTPARHRRQTDIALGSGLLPYQWSYLDSACASGASFDYNRRRGRPRGSCKACRSRRKRDG